MATYSELQDLLSDGGLTDKVEVAVLVAAEGIVGDLTPPANQAKREQWAEQAFNSPRTEAKVMLSYVIAANKGLTVAAIQGASDAAFQNNVDDAVDFFADLIP